MVSLSGLSISLQMSLVRAIKENERNYNMNRQWHKPTALSTANKAHCTEQIAIMNERLNELMMMDELGRRDEKKKMLKYLLNELLQCLQWPLLSLSACTVTTSLFLN